MGKQPDTLGGFDIDRPLEGSGDTETFDIDKPLVETRATTAVADFDLSRPLERPPVFVREIIRQTGASNGFSTVMTVATVGANVKARISVACSSKFPDNESAFGIFEMDNGTIFVLFAASERGSKDAERYVTLLKRYMEIGGELGDVDVTRAINIYRLAELAKLEWAPNLRPHYYMLIIDRDGVDRYCHHGDRVVFNMVENILVVGTRGIQTDVSNLVGECIEEIADSVIEWSETAAESTFDLLPPPQSVLVLKIGD